jgi:hypothetical protein
MPKLKLDDVEYNTEDMSEEALAQVRSLQFLEVKLNELRQEIAVCKTAQIAYLTEFKRMIDEGGIQPVAEEVDHEE